MRIGIRPKQICFVRGELPRKKGEPPSFSTRDSSSCGFSLRGSAVTASASASQRFFRWGRTGSPPSKTDLHTSLQQRANSNKVVPGLWTQPPRPHGQGIGLTRRLWGLHEFCRPRSHAWSSRTRTTNPSPSGSRERTANPRTATYSSRKPHD